ncbi:ribulose-phosphate 3-epimerase [Enterobacter hormaechei subsp. hormaechei]|uniref:ribulose-phosphate 3-epimerase n=1 Tax=Enterobacteriaceae TaxID=543 RepID=UPI001FF21855|nr:ribulose-phosphate 3-epimerase [Klebsiella pneumoniae]MCK0975343.1 ribulose-phosphate 3-epimerase [Klebsiella pneumoniae]MDX7254224.1 ribulose-phosphate 3-epimerase [Klebsiella pneumoniae]
MTVKFCPSLMCVDFSKLSEEITLLEAAGVDMFHIDVMDGSFVPNFALGPEDIKAVSKLSKLPYDVHLMVTNPDPYIERFAELGCSIIYVHAEAPVHLHRTLSNIRRYGVRAGVAINPGTPLSCLEEVLDVVDVVMIMSVNPGFAGQPFIDSSVSKIKRLKSMLQQYESKAKIAIDGAISPTVVKTLANDVDMFILGTAGLFRKGMSYNEAVDVLKNQLVA